MRRLWMSLLLVPVMAVAAPTAAWASPTAPAARTAPAAAARALQPGSSGASVKALQRRLAALKYYPGSIDGRFGTSTLEAVWAFYEVQGLPAHNYVTSAMNWALAHPRAPRVLVPHGGANRVEISLSREVLVLYHNSQVELISHVSTGGHYYYCSLGEMFNPVFFIGTAFAIHGDTDVPLAPVSHGCVRVPMDIAAFFHKLVHVPGEPVYIR